MIHSASNRACLFLLVRSHSQMQYYFNISSTRRAANDADLTPPVARPLAKVVEIHPVKQLAIAR